MEVYCKLGCQVLEIELREAARSWTMREAHCSQHGLKSNPLRSKALYLPMALPEIPWVQTLSREWNLCWGEDWSFSWALIQTPGEACFWSPFSEATASSTFHQSAQVSVCWSLKVLAYFPTTYLSPLLRFCPQPHGLLSTLVFSLSLLVHTYFTLYYHVSGISEGSQQPMN